MKFNTRLFVTAWFCLAVVAAHVPAFAQGGGATTSLSGTVTDTSGAIIPGANVVVKSNATATQFDAVTNESGYFSVPALDPGAYTVTVTLMGFKTAVLNDVRVNASTPATVKVALAVGGLEETVVVTGGAEIIQTTVGGGHVDDRRQSDSEDPDRQPQRAGVRRAAAGRADTRRPGRQPRLDGQRPAAERDQHHHRRHERAGQPPEDGRRLLRARQPASRRHRRSHRQLGGAGRGQHRAGRGPDPLRDALGQQPVHGQRLLLPAALQAQREHVVQQPRQRAEEQTTCSISLGRDSAAPSSSRDCGTAGTRRSSSSTTRSRARRAAAPRTGRSCTRARSRAGSATPRAARPARSTSSAWAPRTRPSIRRLPGCSAIFGAPLPAARWSTTPIRSHRL